MDNLYNETKNQVELLEYFDERNMGLDEITVTPFGILIQEKNVSELDKDLFKVVTKAKPLV